MAAGVNAAPESLLCAGELASLAQSILKAAPESPQWQKLRTSLKANADMLQGDTRVASSFMDLQPLLPYIESSLIIINRCTKATKTYRSTERLLERTSDLREYSRQLIKHKLTKSKQRIVSVMLGIENTFNEINLILLRILNKRGVLTYRKMMSFSFSLSKLRGQLDGIENHLKEAVLIFGIPAIRPVDIRRGSLATAADMLGKMCPGLTNRPDETQEITNVNRESIEEYKQEMRDIDQDAKDLTSRLKMWQRQFWFRNKAKVLLSALGCCVVIWAIMAATNYLVGANSVFLFFLLFTTFFVVRMEQTQERLYYIAVAVAIKSFILELFGVPGLTLFNIGGAVFFAMKFLEFMEASVFL